MNVQRLDHLVFAVQEMAPALADWARAFDLRPDPAPYQPAGTHLLLASLPLDSDQGGAFLELVADIGWRELALSDAEARERLPRSRRVARFLASQDEGMFSVSLQVDDLDAAVRELRAKGVPVSDPEPGVLESTRIARIPRASAHGVAIQLIERA